MFICKDCKLEKENLSVFVIPQWGKGVNRYCTDCKVPRGGVPDVYFKNPYWDENLGSEESPGAKYVTSARHKSELMRKNNLREAGDRHHGATSFDKISNRHAMASLRRK